MSFCIWTDVLDFSSNSYLVFAWGHDCGCLCREQPCMLFSMNQNWLGSFSFSLAFSSLQTYKLSLPQFPVKRPH